MSTPMIYTLTELATASGATARTIRYYISRGLLPAPAKRGKDAHYTDMHLRLLEQIKLHSAEGLSLEQIKLLLESEGLPESTLPTPEGWHRYCIAPDVEVAVRSEDMAPARQREVMTVLAAVHRLLGVDTNTDEEDQD